MKKRISILMVSACAAALALFALISLGWTNRRFVAAQEKALKTMLQGMAATAALPTDTSAFARDLAAAIDLRVTICDVQGAVLGDSQVPAGNMENHAGREEIAAAIRSGYGTDIRTSASTGERMLYSAIRWGASYLLRFSLPIPHTRDFVRGLLPLYLLLFAGIVCAMLLASRYLGAAAIRPYTRLQQAITTAMREGSRIPPARQEEETRQTAEAFNALLEELHAYIRQAQMEAARIETILADMHEGILMLDKRHRILLCNPAALAFLGVAELPGDTDLLHLCRDRQLEQHMHTALRDMALQELDIERHNKTYRLQITPAPEGALVMIADLSELKRLERMRSDFTANVSHELKTPLTAISGFSELVAEGLVTDAEEIRGHMQTISAEARRMTSLVDDILHLSALEAMRLSEQPALEISEVFHEAMRLLEPECAKKEVHITLTGQGLASVSREHALELAMNLLSNAVRYNVQGGEVHVTIAEDAGCCKIEVVDTGIGIPPAHISRIFERFYRVDKGRSRATGGTGLGLAIVKHITELYGGTIAARSDTDGSVFSLTLPQGPLH